MMGIGTLALYAGGSGEVRFKDVSCKDLNPKFEPKEEVSPHFRMQCINDFYYGWCADTADITRDGILDVISGPFYFLGPDYTERREFTAARTYNPSNQFSQGMVNFAYENPKSVRAPKGAPEGPWKFHAVNFGSGGAEMGAIHPDLYGPAVLYWYAGKK
jgi:hypothetical protein